MITSPLRSPLIMFLLFTLLTSCSGSDNGGGSGENGGGSNSGTNYITWTGSSNGTVVVDATNDHFRFEYPSGLMHFGNTTITNIWVDNSSYLYFNSQIIGSVMYVKSTTGSTITGLVSNSGYFIDFYGPESSLTWVVSSIIPVYSILSVPLKSDTEYSKDFSYTRTAVVSSIENTDGETVDDRIKNAYFENLIEHQDSYTVKKEQ